MKSLILSLFLLASLLCLSPSTAEARPHLLRKAVAWKRDHRPVVKWFVNRQPVRKAYQWKRDHRPVVRFFFVCDVDSQELPV